MFALTMAIGVLALGFGGTAADEADHPRPAAPAPAPNLIDVSATTQTPALFTVTGTDFTPGGRVYLAIYDQMGAKLYETRWIEASPTTTILRHELGDGPRGGDLVTVGGTLQASFGHLCGATAMMRALDETTTTWSNWLTVAPACGADVEPRSGPR
jgi:hypothetical protein